MPINFVSQLPITGSALLARGKGKGADGPVQQTEAQDLFWVMHIVWYEGIAERRGIGQVTAEALENSFAPGPVVKEVFLG